MTDQELRNLIAETFKAIEKTKETQEKDSKELKDSIKELRDSQKETDKQIKELRDSQKQTDKQLRETDEQIKKSSEEWNKGMQELRESQKETDKMQKETERKLDKLEKLYGDSSNNRGEEVEDFFYRYFSDHKELLGIKFDDVKRNIITAEGQEHDIILENGTVSALISVKYKVHKKDIDSLIEKEILRMKYFLNKFGSKHRLYGGIAGYIMKEEVAKYAISKGLFVITRSGENTIFLNKNDFVGKEF